MFTLLYTFLQRTAKIVLLCLVGGGVVFFFSFLPRAVCTYILQSIPVSCSTLSTRYILYPYRAGFLGDSHVSR